VEDSANTILSNVYGGIEDWLLIRHLGSTWEAEAAALAAHHLTELVVEFQAENGVEADPQRLDAKESGLQRIPFEPDQYSSLSEFANAHREYLKSLKALVDSHVWSLESRVREVN
jgi:hypothetical protein